MWFRNELSSLAEVSLYSDAPSIYHKLSRTPVCWQIDGEVISTQRSDNTSVVTLSTSLAQTSLFEMAYDLFRTDTQMYVLVCSQFKTCKGSRFLNLVFLDTSRWPCGLRRESGPYCLLGLRGLNPTGGVDVCVLRILCCQVDVSATGRSLVAD